MGWIPSSFFFCFIYTPIWQIYAQPQWNTLIIVTMKYEVSVPFLICFRVHDRSISTNSSCSGSTYTFDFMCKTFYNSTGALQQSYWPLHSVHCNRRDLWRPLCPFWPASAVWLQSLQTPPVRAASAAVHHLPQQHLLCSAALQICCCNCCHSRPLIGWTPMSQL